MARARRPPSWSREPPRRWRSVSPRSWPPASSSRPRRTGSSGSSCSCRPRSSRWPRPRHRRRRRRLRPSTRRQRRRRRDEDPLPDLPRAAAVQRRGQPAPLSPAAGAHRDQRRVGRVRREAGRRSALPRRAALDVPPRVPVPDRVLPVARRLRAAPAGAARGAPAPRPVRAGAAEVLPLGARRRAAQQPRAGPLRSGLDRAPAPVAQPAAHASGAGDRRSVRHRAPQTRQQAPGAGLAAKPAVRPGRLREATRTRAVALHAPVGSGRVLGCGPPGARRSSGRIGRA